MSDWFTQNAPASAAPAAGDWFSQNAPGAAPKAQAQAPPPIELELHDAVGPARPQEHEADTWWGGFNHSIKQQVMDAVLNNPMLQGAAHPKDAGDFAALLLPTTPGAAAGAANGFSKEFGPAVAEAGEVATAAKNHVLSAADALRAKLPVALGGDLPVSYPATTRLRDMARSAGDVLAKSPGDTMFGTAKKTVGGILQKIPGQPKTFQDLPLIDQMEKMGPVATDPVRARMGGPVAGGAEAVASPSFNEQPLFRQMEAIPETPAPQGGRVGAPPIRNLGSETPPTFNDLPLHQQMEALPATPAPQGRVGTPPIQNLGREVPPPPAPFNDLPLSKQMEAMPTTGAAPELPRSVAPRPQNLGNEVPAAITPPRATVANGNDVPLWKQMEQLFANEPAPEAMPRQSGVSYINEAAHENPPLAEAVSGIRQTSSPPLELPAPGNSSATRFKVEPRGWPKSDVELVNELLAQQQGEGAVRVKSLKEVPYPAGDDPLAKAIRQRANIAESLANPKKPRQFNPILVDRRLDDIRR